MASILQIIISAVVSSMCVFTSILILVKYSRQGRALWRFSALSDSTEFSGWGSWYAHHITTKASAGLYHALEHSSTVLLFWGLNALMLPQEIMLIISLTWFLFPLLLAIGFISGYSYISNLSERKALLMADDFTMIVKHLLHHRDEGNELARKTLEKMLERQDEIGNRVREIFNSMT